MAKKVLISLVLLVPAALFVWDMAGLFFFEDTRTEREVMGDNFLEHGRYPDAIDDLVAEHGADTAVLVVHVDLRSAQFTLVTSAATATVAGFGWRGGGAGADGPGGSPVEDYQRPIGAAERPTGTLGMLVKAAPRTIVRSIERQGVDIDDVIRLRLEGQQWSVLVATGPDPEDTERWTAAPDGSAVTPEK
jgi:hypothetical protein